eukprot:TCONS_00071687-protein
MSEDDKNKNNSNSENLDAAVEGDQPHNDSVREITQQEKEILNSQSKTFTKCHGGNTHVWKLDGEICSVFSDIQVKTIAFGSEHCLVLTEDHNIYTYGSNTHGQLGQGDCEERKELCLIDNLSENTIHHISCGERHNVVLDDAGILYTWGDSTHGQCGLGCTGIFPKPQRVRFLPTRNMSLKKEISPENFIETLIRDVSCGEVFSVAIDTKGCIWSWGSGCALGHGQDYEISTSPKLLKSLSNKKAIFLSCGAYHCVVITQDEFIDDMLNIPSSPDYRTASVSSNYYSELKAKKVSSAMANLQQSTMLSTTAEMSPIFEPKHSKSESALKEKAQTNTIDFEPSNSINNQKKEGPGDTDSIASSRDESLSSSQFYSASDISSLESPIQSQHWEEKETNDDKSLEKLSSSSSIDKDGEITPLQNKDNEIFSGKKAFFSEENIQESESPIPGRSRSSEVVTRKISLPTFNSAISIDDTLNTNLFEMSTSTQVWTFGKNSYGQLGHGDVEDRFVPTLVEKLGCKGIIKVAAGSYHTLLLSSQGKVYSCGDNAFGQLGQMKTMMKLPKKVKVLDGVRVWDFAAGRNFSLFLGDSDRNKSDVFFCGDGVEHRNNVTQRRSSISEPIIEISHLEKRSKWRLSSRKKTAPARSTSPNMIDIKLRKITHFQEKELIKLVTAKDYSFACISQSFSHELLLEPIYKFARAERLIYQQMMTIQKVVIEPFISTDAWNNLSKQIAGDALLLLIDSFVDLLNGISTELMNLSEIIRKSLPVQDLFSYVFSDSFRTVYERYAKCYADALAVGLIQMAVKPCNNIISKRKELMKNLEKQLSLTQANFESLLKVPLLRCHVYCDLAKRLSTHCQGENETKQLKEVIQRWLVFSESSISKLTLANATNSFWNDSHTKLIETLKEPSRRVLKSSKTDPLTLARASRLSSHSYILCNNVFVHVQYNRTFQTFPLVTLWADAENDTEHTHNAIKVTTPEESFVLVAGTPDGKLAWLKELNQAIALALAASSQQGVDIGSVNSSGLLLAAVAREATYTYQNHMTYRQATYVGMWMSGQPHGRGRMNWEDGMWYEGEFVQGRFEGFGQMFFPKNATNLTEKTYEGEWKEGKMFGYGKMNYGQNEEYTGYFKENARHGHGTLKYSSNKTSLDTIYVGDWINDMKFGYGVIDYIIRGEKYMGMWSNDQRQGFGVVVTVDGVYYEGKFIQNRLAGRGILLSEDDTRYEGEFTADMLLNGKGILTMPNGDFIDGSFYGTWGENIKVNGTFSKFSNPRTTGIPHSASDLDRLRNTDFTIHADTKWQSLFNECLYQLGCQSPGDDVTPDKAWRSVYDHVLKAAGSLSTIRGTNARIDYEFIRNNEYKETMNLAHNLKGLKEFLSQAFDIFGHPLHTLVEGLSDVYRATYVGVGAHRRLLPHAVNEAKSYVTRLFKLLRILFPDLHDEEFVFLSNETVDGYTDPPVNSMSLLHPLLLPRLYPPLFTLYALQTEKTDAEYIEKLHYLNKRSDIALMSYLEIKRDFWLLPPDIDPDDTDIKHEAYKEAIDTLGQISTMYSPMEKIDVLMKTFDKIHEEVENYFKTLASAQGKVKMLSMDDLLPIFHFILIRARIPHLGSEIQFIDDMVGQGISHGEASHRFTTLSVC